MTDANRHPSHAVGLSGTGAVAGGNGGAVAGSNAGISIALGCGVANAAIGTPMLTAKTSAPLKNVVIHFMAVPPFTLDLVTHVSDCLSPVLVPPLAAAAAPGLPGLSV